MKMYRADYACEDGMEIILAANDDEALSEAWKLEQQHGPLFNLDLLDDDYNVVRTVL